jgi:DNA-binding NarL/FixJ family response regulator
MRQSLRILLKLVDGMELVGQASDQRSALSMIAEHRPALVVLDTNLPGAALTPILELIRSNGGSIRSLVLVDNDRLGRDAYEDGADAVLIKGFSTARLLDVVGSLLPREEVGTSEGDGET